MRLKKRPRVDALANEVRARKGSLGRWLYLGAIVLFLVWLGDLFAGELVYFKADGLVLRDRVVVATQFPASIETVAIEEGDTLTPGEPLLTVRSQSVEETLAELSAELALLLTRAAEMRVRAQVIEAISPVVRSNLSAAEAARASALNKNSRGLFTDLQRAQLSEQVLSSVRADAEVRAERAAIAADLPTIEAAVARAEQALTTLTESYANGALQAPAAGVVGYLHVAPGSVVRAGEPIMEIFHGEPFVLAFVPEGALYDVEPGDAVNVRLGFDQHEGVIERIYPVTAELPPEFADRFNQQRRAPLAKIKLAKSDTPPTLFARTQVTARGWPPAWFKRLIGIGIGNGAPDRQQETAAGSQPVTEPEAPAQQHKVSEPAPAASDQVAALHEAQLPVAEHEAATSTQHAVAVEADASVADEGSTLIADEPVLATTAEEAPAVAAEVNSERSACGQSKVLYWLRGGKLQSTRLDDGTVCDSAEKRSLVSLRATARR